MEIKYLMDKSLRKALTHKIAELTGEAVKYLGAPTLISQIVNSI